MLWVRKWHFLSHMLKVWEVFDHSQLEYYKKVESENFLNVKELRFKIPIYLVIIRYRASLVAQTVKNLPTNIEDAVSILGSGRSFGEGNGNPLQFSCLGNPMDRGACQAMVHRVTKSQKGLKRLSTHVGTKNWFLRWSVLLSPMRVLSSLVLWLNWRWQ